jgi:hypothetical protein
VIPLFHAKFNIQLPLKIYVFYAGYRTHQLEAVEREVAAGREHPPRVAAAAHHAAASCRCVPWHGGSHVRPCRATASITGCDRVWGR